MKPRRTKQERRLIIEESRKKNQETLSVVAFGINLEVRRRIESTMDEIQSTCSELNMHPFFFYEYFLDPPIVRGDKEPENSVAFAPFLTRLVVERDYMAVPEGGFEKMEVARFSKVVKGRLIPMMPTSPNNVETNWSTHVEFRTPLTKSAVLNCLHNSWEGRSAINPPNRTGDWWEEPELDKCLEESNGVVTFKNAFKVGFDLESYVNNFEEKSFASSVREFCACIYPWLLSDVKETHPETGDDKQEGKLFELMACSISSRTLFLGELILLLPPLQEDSSGIACNRLLSTLRSAVKQLYVPMLTLFDNYVAECELSAKLKEPSSAVRAQPSQQLKKSSSRIKDENKALKSLLERVGSGRPPVKLITKKEFEGLSRLLHKRGLDCTRVGLFCKLLRTPPEEWTDRLSDIERALVELWAQRLHLYFFEINGNDETKETLRDSLVFATYLIASPGMVSCIRQAINVRHIRENNKVKTALVIGDPGSGKDSMARLVRLFSPGYRFGGKCVLNMAMLRPKELVVPFLFGLDARYQQQTGKNAVLSFEGVFHQPLRASVEHMPPVLASKGFTFTLDELNSLDIDAQGALLRLLENAEVSSLGSIKHESVDYLIVGIVNEEPELIMKKRTLDNILRDQELFGGVVGESLYEMLRTQRRLREDLYFRLARGGEIRVPKLRDRREDIPLLLYFIVSKDLISLIPEQFRNGKWKIELPVYEEFMNPALKWEGNIRDLQAAAKKLLEIAGKEYSEMNLQKSGNDKFLIRRRHALKALDLIAMRKDSKVNSGTSSHSA